MRACFGGVLAPASPPLPEVDGPSCSWPLRTACTPARPLLRLENGLRPASGCQARAQRARPSTELVAMVGGPHLCPDGYAALIWAQGRPLNPVPSRKDPGDPFLLRGNHSPHSSLVWHSPKTLLAGSARAGGLPSSSEPASSSVFPRGHGAPPLGWNSMKLAESRGPDSAGATLGGAWSWPAPLACTQTWSSARPA